MVEKGRGQFAASALVNCVRTIDTAHTKLRVRPTVQFTTAAPGDTPSVNTFLSRRWEMLKTGILDISGKILKDEFNERVRTKDKSSKSFKVVWLRYRFNLR